MRGLITVIISPVRDTVDAGAKTRRDASDLVRDS